MTITKKLLSHLAHLSRLSLTEDESDRFTHDLNALLQHFQELESIDVSAIEPMIGGTVLKNTMRTDAVRLSNEMAVAPRDNDITRAFPDAYDGHLKVPTIL